MLAVIKLTGNDSCIVKLIKLPAYDRLPPQREAVFLLDGNELKFKPVELLLPSHSACVGELLRRYRCKEPRQDERPDMCYHHWRRYAGLPVLER